MYHRYREPLKDAKFRADRFHKIISIPKCK